MRRSIVLILMMTIVGMFSISALAAEGVQESGNRTTQPQDPYYNSERMSVEGTVELTAGGVELKTTDGKEYELMYPRYLAEDMDVRDGQTVTVEGYLVPGPRWETDESEKHLRVETAVIDGKEYNLAANFGPGYGPQGGGYGPGARGPRGGYGGRGHGMMGRW